MINVFSPLQQERKCPKNFNTRQEGLVSEGGGVRGALTPLSRVTFVGGIGAIGRKNATVLALCPKWC
jgi:hypothetical protein